MWRRFNFCLYLSVSTCRSYFLFNCKSYLSFWGRYFIFSGVRGGGGDSSPFTLSLCHVKDCNFSACWFNNSIISPSMYKFGFSVCLFVSNKRQNGWTDRAQIFCGTSRDHRGGLRMIKISNMCFHQNSIFIKFLKILKIHEFFCENLRIIFVLFYDVHKENMFTINLEDGHEAPSKASYIKY